jgi:hypothetical protein
MTLALHESDGYEDIVASPYFKADFYSLATLLPLKVELGEAKMFGEKQDIPVRLVTFPDPAVADRVNKFMETWHKPPAKDLKFRGPRQIFHVTMDKVAPEEAEAMKALVFTELYVSLVGKKGLRLLEA